jgi:hypothetical protein
MAANFVVLGELSLQGPAVIPTVPTQNTAEFRCSKSLEYFGVIFIVCGHHFEYTDLYYIL